MFKSIVVGTDGSDTAGQAVRQAVDLAKSVGATLEIVSAYEPVPRSGCAQERREAPEDLQWAINPREDVDATLEAAAALGARGRRRGQRLPAPGRPRRRDPRRRRGARRGPDRGRQQGHDRRQAVPAGLGAQQGLPPRALLGADHPDDLAGCRARPGPPGRARRCASRSRPSPGARGRTAGPIRRVRGTPSARRRAPRAGSRRAPPASVPRHSHPVLPSLTYSGQAPDRVARRRAARTRRRAAAPRSRSPEGRGARPRRRRRTRG